LEINNSGVDIILKPAIMIWYSINKKFWWNYFKNLIVKVGESFLFFVVFTTRFSKWIFYFQNNNLR